MKKVSKPVIFAMLATGLIVMGMPPLLFAEKGAPHWSYEGQEGPTHWGELADEYKMCSEGVNQSPIDLIADYNADLPSLEFEYYSSTVDEINNGHTIQQNIKPGSFLRIPERGENFELKQFHFHSPSEHTVGGKSFDMELHFVHAHANGGLLVVGVLMNEGEEHPVLKKLWAFMPEKAGDTSQQPVAFEETGLLPPTDDYFTYGGSLTTPPCSEGVRWIVLKRPIEASAEQIATFKSRIGEANNRPIQSNNARLIID
jgi:carbonic anhydrase